MLPLLTLLVLGASAAAPSPEAAVKSVRAAIDAGNPDRAIMLVDDALRAFGARDTEAVYTLRVMRVEANLAKSNAAAVKEIVAEFPEKYRHTEANVRRLTYLGFVQAHLGFTKESEALLSQAEAIAKQYQRDLLGEVYRGKALASREEKDAREAIRYAAMHKQRETEARANVTLASILMTHSRYTEAAEACERALAIARLPNTIQNVQGTLGWVYIELGDYETAEELFTKAEATAARIGNRMNRIAWLIQLGNLRFRKRDYTGADRLNKLAIDTGASGRELGYAWANRARAAFELKRYDDARTFNATARTKKEAAGDKEAQWSSDIVDARVLMAKERNYTAAEKLLLNVLGKTRTHKLDAQTQLARLHVQAKPTHARAAFEKAVAIVRESRGKIEDRDLRFAFFNTAAEMLDDYVDFLVATNRSDDALAVAEASRAESLEEGHVETPQRQLAPQAIARDHQATILSYWLGRNGSYLWEITGAGTKLHRLPPESLLEDELDMYRRQLLRQGVVLTKRGESLFNMLVAPAKIARGSRVLVVADGPLHTLNFDTLVAPHPQHFWIEDVIVTHAASLQLLARKKRPATAAPTLLLVGNPSSPDPDMFPPLHHAASEMSAIEKRFTRPTVLAGAKATPANYRAASPGKYDYVHFVAHAVATRKRPLDSAVILASDGKSYKLLARDIDAMPLNARLVTISSCESAGTRTYSGEGVVGLAWAFLHAGADQVIASLWKVDDAASAKLMDTMYAHIRQGHDPAVALRNAKRELMRTYSKKPRYWAPFVLYSGN